MEAECEKIIGFAELRDFEHVAVKNFSSGMMARLGFSIAVNVRPDILIIDEILSVGDFKFQEKSRRRVLELMAQSATVLMVSHSIAQIREMCTRAALLESGRLVAVGDAGEICDLYQQA
jgi:ABC-type polysaccharide/polyol phosphate transport system ATPase subunit